jgi:hypothetical protein
MGRGRVTWVGRRLLLLGAVLVLAACGADDIRGEDGRVATPGDWSVFDLRPGDCIGDTEGLTGDTDAVPLVPCDQPHQLEVFAVVRYPSDEYPGAATIAAFADNACLTVLTEDLGLAVDGVSFTYLLPSSLGWVEQGDRSVVCVLGSTTGAVSTGSVIDGTADAAQLGSNGAG